MAILGAGPVGSVCAMFLLRQGVEPLLIEQENFPRHRVGESISGVGCGIIRELDLESQMDRLGCLRKSGVKVHAPNGKSAWFVPSSFRDQENHVHPIDTWQVRRSTFDAMLLDEARQRGSRFLAGKATRPLRDSAGTATGVAVQLDDGSEMEVHSRLLLDCTGPATFLAKSQITGPKSDGSYARQIAIFCEVTGAHRDDGSSPARNPNNTVIFPGQPYHWSWFIPLDDQVVSVGVVVPSVYFRSFRESPQAFFCRELHHSNPRLRQYLPEINLSGPVRVATNYSYQVADFTGPGFLCLGGAHRFVDPIFAFGVSMGLREAKIAAQLVPAWLEGDPNSMAAYAADRECENDVLEDTVDAFWQRPLAFAHCVRKYPDEISDIFAGRSDGRNPSPALASIRRIVKRKRHYGTDPEFPLP